MDTSNLFKEPNEFDSKALLSNVVEYYHQCLKLNTKAIQALQELGITSSEAITYFKLGYCDRTLGKMLPEKNRKSGALIRGALQRLGIYKPNGRELFRGSLVIPVIENGVIKHLYGRKVSSRLRPGTSIHTHLPHTEPGFFNRKAIDTCEEVIFCSTISDALTFWCAGYKNVTCQYGQEESL